MRIYTLLFFAIFLYSELQYYLHPKLHTMHINSRRRPVTGRACNILNLRIFRFESAKHSGAKKFIQIECIQTGALHDGGPDQRDCYTSYTPSSLWIWNRFYARVICMTAYIFIELQIARAAPASFPGFLAKSGKNYRLRTARRIVQTPAGNLDKWRSNDSRPADLLAEWARVRLRSSPCCDKKKFRDQTAKRGTIDMHQHFATNWFFFFFILSDSSLRWLWTQ